MRDDFGVFILTHGRPDRVYTYSTIRSHGYTGEVYFVVDDDDDTLPEYRRRFGDDRVLVFSKAEVAETFDEGDNFGDRRTIVYARNACFDLARNVGKRHFIQLDDDYSGFYYRFDKDGKHGNWKLDPLDDLFEMLIDFFDATPFVSVAISQGGDHIGGGENHKVIGTKRKAMNSFVCSTDRPFQFVGRINEDVNTYTSLQRRGGPFLTFLAAQVNQKATQSNAGGMTDLYLDAGTYVKSFYSVMYAPSCVTVAPLRDARAGGGFDSGERPARIHHRVQRESAAPLIIHERYRKDRPA